MITLDEIKNSLETKGKFWIVFIGSSLTSCEWVHPNWREIVEYVLKDEVTKRFNKEDWKIPSWGIRCFNYGYDGSTTKDLVQKLPDMLLTKPNLVLGVTGGNDSALGISVEESMKNISQILDTFTTSGAKVVWSTSIPSALGFPRNERYAPYAQAVTETFHDTESIQILDMFHSYQQFPLEKFFTFRSEEIVVEGIKEGDPDPIHPNQLGNAYIAKLFLKEVFGIEFHPEKYIETTLAGEKYPKY